MLCTFWRTVKSMKIEVKETIKKRVIEDMRK
jgi:hypothetical protein